jgi:hypothetical protein
MSGGARKKRNQMTATSAPPSNSSQAVGTQREKLINWVSLGDRHGHLMVTARERRIIYKRQKWKELQGEATDK